MSRCADVFVRATNGEWQVLRGPVAEFLREVALLRANLELIAATPRLPRELPECRSQIELRLDSIEATALRARELGAGVLNLVTYGEPPPRLGQWPGRAASGWW